MPEKLALSGWMASGKDTVAEEVMGRLGAHDAVRMSYARPIRGEMRRIVGMLRAGANAPDIAEHMGCEVEDAEAVARLLSEDLRHTPDLDPDDRTAGMRQALQHWGTDVRRRQDEDYWVRASLAEAERHVAEGRSVYYTDLRFPNEVAALVAAGYYTVRIDISRSTQARRLAERDSLAGGTALNHPSETSLDHYPTFHLRVGNDHDLSTAVETVVAGYNDWKRRKELLDRVRGRQA